MFKFIKKKLMPLIEGIKVLKELDTTESNVDTTSQMSAEELIKISEERFKKHESSDKTREELMETINGYLNINRQWQHHSDREWVNSYIDKLNTNDMTSDSAKEALEP